MDTIKPLSVNQGLSTGLYLLHAIPYDTTSYGQNYIYGVSPFKLLLAVAADADGPFTTCFVVVDEQLVGVSQQIYAITNDTSYTLHRYNRSCRTAVMTDRNTLRIDVSSRGSAACIPYRIYGIR